MKRLLFIVHYFYPDVASTAQLMTELCGFLKDYFEIEVISVTPGYDGQVGTVIKKNTTECLDGMKIYRAYAPPFIKERKLSRIKNILFYFFNAIRILFKLQKPDIIFAISQPPILGGILGFVAKKIHGAKLIYNIQDFNPEQIEAIGYFKNKAIIYLLKKLDTLSCKSSDSIILVGNEMLETIRKRGIDSEKAIVINNWIDEEDIIPLHKTHPRVASFLECNGLRDKFIIMYSGNIGLYYDLDNLIKVFAAFKHMKDIMFVFIGEGAKKKELMEFCDNYGIRNIKFIGYQNKEDSIYSLNAADVHLVASMKGIKGVSVPSKIYGIMAAGKYTLGIVEESSEAANLIARSGCGQVVQPGDYKKVYETIKEIVAMDRVIIRQQGLLGRNFLIKNHSKIDMLNKYKSILDEL